MRRWGKSFFVILVLAVILGITWSKPGVCLGCVWKGACYSNSICGSRCICVKRSTIDVSGFCAVAY